MVRVKKLIFTIAFLLSFFAVFAQQNITFKRIDSNTVVAPATGVVKKTIIYDVKDNTFWYLTTNWISGTFLAHAGKVETTGSADMLKATYDPTNVNGDAFDMDNMVEGTTGKILTTTERTNIGTSITHVTSDGSDHTFIDQDVTSGSSPTFDGTNITGIPLTGAANLVVTEVRNSSGATLTKASPVYVSGFHIGTSEAEVSEADSDSPTTMNAIGLIRSDILNNSNGDVIETGELTGLNTSSWSLGDVLYVSGDPTTTFGLTNVKPTGAALIQNVGEVLRSHPSDGVILVGITPRNNDLPNIADAKLWVGNASGVPTEVSISGDATMANTGAITIAAKAVDVAMLADGTDGELITWDATGVATTVPVGTATHVLTSNGVGAAPTFQVSLGNVNNSGTPVNNQLAVWTNSTTIEGDANLTWDGATFDITSTTGALEVPRMTNVQRNAITPANGMQLYNTDSATHNYYEDSRWVSHISVVGVGDTSARNDYSTAGASVNDLWYCTTTSTFEHWDGDVWLSAQTIKVRNQTGGAVLVGQSMKLDGTDDGFGTPDAIYTAANDARTTGVVIEAGGTYANGDFVVLAWSGIHPVYSVFALTQGDILRPTGSGGHDDVASSPGAGAIGITLVSKASGAGVTPAFLTGIERY